MSDTDTEFDAEQFAFECFATAHPHEAAEHDWPKFLAFFRQKTGSDMSESEIRAMLAETEEQFPEASK